MMLMMKEMMKFDNCFGRVAILREGIGFTVLYSVRKTPGVYRCRVHNTILYDVALRKYNRHVGALKRMETSDRKKEIAR